MRAEDAVRLQHRSRPDRDRRAGNITPTFGVRDIDAAIAELRGQDVKVEDWHEIPEMVRLSTFYDPDGTPWMLAQTLDAKEAFVAN